jgi:hypothetical protein
MGLQWHLILSSVCFSLMVNYVEHIFMWFLSTCLLSLEKCWYKIFCTFKSCYFSFHSSVVRGFFKNIYSGYQFLIRHMICKYFPLFCGLFFYFLTMSFTTQFLKFFMKIRHWVFLLSLILNVIFNKSFPNLRSRRFIYIFLRAS